MSQGVRHALLLEAPECSFTDEVIERLASVLEENLAEDSEYVLYESCCPILIDSRASSNDDEAKLLCQKILAHFRKKDSLPVPSSFKELQPWLGQLHLLQYADRAKTWCALNNAGCLDQLLQNWQSFADNLQLKMLERKRVEKEFNIRRPLWFGPVADPYKYTMLEEIGRGATAHVHKCSRGQEILAVKNISITKMMMQPRFKHDADKLHNEVSILFSLRHPRIVALHDVIEVQDQMLHLVMEYVEGGELHDKIVEKKSFSERLAARVFLQVAEGLAFIHSKDIVHRDLKPENILVDDKSSTEQNLQVKLSDFGHSKLINNGYSAAKTTIGTKGYWAPEVCDPRTAALGYDFTADLWSLGVVLYVMLMGRLPVRMGENCTDAKIHTASYRSLASGREVSDSSRNLICSLIRVNRNKRLPVDECLKHPWVATAAAAASDQHVPQTLEMRIPLPTQPSKDQVQLLRADLAKWQMRFHLAAVVKHLEVIVTYGEDANADPQNLDMALQELHEHLRRHFGPTS
jgi:serine/threonine protein kinase